MAVDTGHASVADPVYSVPNNQPAGVELRSLPLVSIDASPLNPRKHFDEAGLQELTDSIRMLGIQQPIVVRAKEDKDFGEYFEIIMGERRYRAAKLADLKEIPALVRTDVTDADLVRLALEENTRRRDLSAVEEAEAYHKMLELEPSLTQEGLAKRLGVSQSKVANALRLLKLPPRVMVLLMKGQLSGSHGVTLCSLIDMTEECILLAERAAEEAWPQSRLETEVGAIKAAQKEKQAADSLEASLPLEGPAATTEAAAETADEPPPPPPAETEEEAGEEDTAAVPVIVDDSSSSDSAPAPTEELAAEEPAAAATAAAPAPAGGDALTRPIENAPAAPAPAPAPVTNAATPTGTPRKAMTALVWEDQNEWLVGQQLSVMAAIDRLREVSLSARALDALRAFAQKMNDKRPGEAPLSTAEVLDMIVITRAQAAGIAVDSPETEGAESDE